MTVYALDSNPKGVCMTGLIAEEITGLYSCASQVRVGNISSQHTVPLLVAIRQRLQVETSIQA
jgi:hypothetical protein